MISVCENWLRWSCQDSCWYFIGSSDKQLDAILFHLLRVASTLLVVCSNLKAQQLLLSAASMWTIVDAYSTWSLGWTRIHWPQFAEALSKDIFSLFKLPIQHCCRNDELRLLSAIGDLGPRRSRRKASIIKNLMQIVLSFEHMIQRMILELMNSLCTDCLMTQRL
jgi:hypothetical protein